MVAELWAQQRLPVLQRHLLPAPAFHLQAGLGVQPIDPLVIDHAAFLPQLQINHAGPIATVPVSECDDPVV